ncbi:group III truncated hemoglobin [Chelatococcus asaccharovorans]|uniref:Hemoglobin n=1 Tax=Chelatococcus asaccharovorans TaxID=28210 RepID=A0A2V3UDQ3_9HYPH|nr:group III truncated hemoglobin [Chelatococcus asaccharovorans]MBS7707200.1 group III truncated hemoglobin [Chelatococcus asaccharovorans]PXW63382.1 hemoglobin [Chelatococcus asaccharovorans]
MKGRPAPRTFLADGTPLPAVLDEAMIHAVVHGFYARIREDELLGPVFNGAIAAEQWPRHLAKMCDFWSSMLLRTGRYEGRPLAPHLAIPGLGEEHFRRWLTLFQATVRALCPSDVASIFMDRALRVAHSFRLAVAFHRGENSLEVRPILAESL